MPPKKAAAAIKENVQLGPLSGDGMVNVAAGSDEDMHFTDNDIIDIQADSSLALLAFSLPSMIHLSMSPI